MDVVYLDYNASTVLPVFLQGDFKDLLVKTYGNPSSLHKLGRLSRKYINEAKEIVAAYIHCDPDNIFWTSGASEANSWVFHSVAQRAKQQGRSPHFIVSEIEHESTLLAAKAIDGAQVSYLRVHRNGCVDLNHLDELLDQNTSYDLVSVLYANNETGAIQPIEIISKKCQNFNVSLHVDCVQALGKVSFSLKKLNITYATFSGHKIGTPKGVGFLVMQPELSKSMRIQDDGRLLYPLIHGKQQKALRGGTENPFAIALLGKILKNQSSPLFPEHLAQWHRQFEIKILESIPGTVIHAAESPRLLNTTYVGFNDVDGDSILMNLDLEGVCASSGSACSSGSLNPSHVLLAMGCDKKISRSSIRFSSGLDTKWEHFEYVLKILPEIVERSRTNLSED